MNKIVRSMRDNRRYLISKMKFKTEIFQRPRDDKEFTIYQSMQPQANFQPFQPDVNFNFEKFWSELLTFMDDSLKHHKFESFDTFFNYLGYFYRLFDQYQSHPYFADQLSPEAYKARCLQVLPPLFDFITTAPFFSFKLQHTASLFFHLLYEQLIKNPLPLEELHFSLDKFLNLQKYIIAKKRLISCPSFDEVIHFLTIIHYNLTETEGQVLLAAYSNNFGALDDYSQKVSTVMLRCYPTRFENIEKIVDEFLPDLPHIIDYTNLSLVLSYFVDAFGMKCNTQFFDWKPHLPAIFSSLSTFFNPSITIMKDKYNHSLNSKKKHKEKPTHKKGPIFDSKLQFLLNSFLIEYDEEKGQETAASISLKYLKELINSYILTSHSNITNPSFYPFMEELTLGFWTLIDSLNSLKRTQSEKYQNVNITQETRREFADIMLPLFNHHMLKGKPSHQSLLHLCYISPHILPQVLQFLVKHLVDIEFGSLSTNCFSILTLFVNAAFSEENINASLQYLPEIVDACILAMANSSSNYDHAVNLLDELSCFITIPSQEEINSQLTIKQRLAANSILKTIDPRLKYSFVHLQTRTNDATDKTDYFSLPAIFHSPYFSIFDDSYYETIIIPKVFEYLNNFLSDYSLVTDLGILRSITSSKPEICLKILFPKLVEKFRQSKLFLHKLNWAKCILSLIIPSPALIPNIPTIIEIIKECFAYNKEKLSSMNDSAINESSIPFKIATMLTVEMFSVFYHSYHYYDNTVIEDGKYIWGRKYYISEVPSEWFVLDDSLRKSTLNSLYDIVEPCLNDFSLFPSQIQKELLSLFLILKNQWLLPQQFVSSSNQELPNDDPLKRIFNKFFSVVKEIFTKDLSAVIKEKSAELLSHCFPKKKPRDQTVSCYPIGLSKRTLLKHILDIISLNWDGFTLVVHNSTLFPDDVRELFESIVYSAPNQLRSTIMDILIEIFHSSTQKDKYILKNLAILEDDNHSEDQLITALIFLFSPSVLINIFHNSPQLSTLCLAIARVKYSKDWGIDHILSRCIQTLQGISIFNTFQDSPEWHDMLNKITAYSQCLDGRYFSSLLSDCIIQKPPPSVGIIKYLFSCISNQCDLNRDTYLWSLKSLFKTMKPIAPRSKYLTIDEFTSKVENDINLPIYLQNLPFVDKTSTGFHCNPSYYILYDGPSVFTEENENNYGEIRKVFLSTFSDNKIFESIFNGFVNSLNDEKVASINYTQFFFWKGLCQTIRSQIITISKPLIESIINSSDSSPSQIVTVCTFLAAVQRGLKHWPTSNKKKAIEELLIPITTELIKNKINDNTSKAIAKMAGMFTKQADYRRSHWVIDVCLNLIKEIQQKKSHATLYKNPLTVLRQYLSSCGFSKLDELYDIMKNDIIPLFDNITEFPLDNLSIIAQMFGNVLSYLPYIAKSDRAAKSIESAHKLFELFFVEIFDKYKETAPECAFMMLNELVSFSTHHLSPVLSFFIDRFKDICLLDSRLSNMTNTKYLHYGKNILMAIANSRWTEYKDNLTEVLLNGIFKNQIMPILNSLIWNARLHLVGFLHLFVFEHFDLLSKDQFSILLNDIITVFLIDPSHEVSENAENVVPFLVAGNYYDNQSGCAEYIIELFEKARKDRKNQKNSILPITMACTLLSSTSLFFVPIPEWLPTIFSYLESAFSAGISKKEILAVVNRFWALHERFEFPEIDEFRYAFSHNYYS